jgi:RNA polymerase-interacting CarD/CdnL/TRCF family regulator
MKLCDVIRGLLLLKHKRKGDLSNSDRRQLNQALELLAEELVHALGRDSLENMMEELRETCKTTIAA